MSATEAQMTEIITRLFEAQAEFIRTRFSAIGSIYQHPETEDFYIGPMGPSVANSLRLTVDRGPWNSTRDWLKACVKAELAQLREDPEAYRKQRLHLKLDTGDPPFTYHIAWLETFLTTMDKLQYLKNIPPAVERPVLHHEELTNSNFLVTHGNLGNLAAIIDFEGARVVPLWSAMKEPGDMFSMELDEEVFASWREIRKRIFLQADSAWEEVEKHHESLRYLHRLVFMMKSRYSIEFLHEVYDDMKAAWPFDDPGFADLDRLIALGPAGYKEGGNKY